MGSRAKLAEFFPKGFHPSDEEIIEDLQHMVRNQTNKCLIPFVDVREHQDEPWDLAAKVDELWVAKLKEWCFIRLLKEKNKKGKRQCCRSTCSGHWKETGKDREIRSKDTKEIIGTRKIFVFHTGRVPHGERTNWVMHEYHLTPKFLARHNKQDQISYVGCSLRKNWDKKDAMSGASSPSGQADDRSPGSNSNVSNIIKERRIAEDAPISMSDNPDGFATEGSVEIVGDGSHSICNIAPETEIAGCKEMQRKNNSGMGAEPCPYDSYYLDHFDPSEFFDDLGTEHGGGGPVSEFFDDLGTEHGGGDGESTGADDNEWINLFNWEEVNDPEGGKGKSL